MRKINIGILGCAKVAKKSAIAAFKEIDSVGKIVIASRDILKAKETSEAFGIDYADSYTNLISRKDIDAVYLPLPIGLHEEWALKAAKFGKHIICEKSLSTSLESVERILDHYKSRKLILFENFMCEYHPQHRVVADLLQQGKIGELITFKGYFGFPPIPHDAFRYSKALGGGALNDAGAYTIFMACKFFGEPTAVTARLFVSGEVDIRGSAFIEFPDNKIAMLSWGFDNLYQNNYSIWGSRGLVQVDRAFAIPGDMKPPISLVQNNGTKEIVTHVECENANQFVLIFKDFIDAILSNNYQIKSSGIFQQAVIMDAVRRSAELGKRVLL